MYRYLFVVVASLSPSASVLADWPTLASSGFVAECIEEAQVQHASVDAQAFCECAADEVSREFSAAELESMADGNVDQASQDRLVEASRSCAEHLSN